MWDRNGADGHDGDGVAGGGVLDFGMARFLEMASVDSEDSERPCGGGGVLFQVF